MSQENVQKILINNCRKIGFANVDVKIEITGSVTRSLEQGFFKIEEAKGDSLKGKLRINEMYASELEKIVNHELGHVKFIFKHPP